METTNNLQKIETIFTSTINWYKKQLDKSDAPTLVSILKNDIKALHAMHKQCVKHFGNYEKKERAEKKRREKEIAGYDATNKEIQKQLKVLRSHNFQRLEDIKDNQEHLGYHTTTLDSNEKMLLSLKKQWDKEDKLQSITQNIFLNFVEMFVSLDIDKKTYSKIIQSARTVITSIPKIHPVITILNAAYDLVKIWIEPPVIDAKNANQFMRWLDQRRLLMHYLKLIIPGL